MNLDVARLWDISIRFLWNDEYLQGLEEFLTAHQVKTILDCAGGTGFPSIALAQRGWAVTYSDGSEIMLERFLQNMQAQKVAIPAYRANWLELRQVLPGRFDAVLCRGNSLVYLDSWNQASIRQDAPVRIESALIQFRQMLNPGGVLYLDLINPKEFDQPAYPLVEEIGEKQIDGQTYRLTWILEHDAATRTRTCRSILQVDGQESVYVYTSYLLRAQELVELMQRAGFSRVEPRQIAGERNYQVFVGYPG
jgi:SAM-dependent methyltransferase